MDFTQLHDLVDLSIPNEPELMQALRKRAEAGLQHTLLGPVLVSVKCSVEVHDPEARHCMHSFLTRVLQGLDHSPQSIVTVGHSGSGKSTLIRTMLSHLLGSSSMGTALLRGCRLLEAFSACCTSNSHSASKCIQQISLKYSHGAVVGASLRAGLLDTSAAVTERGISCAGTHIFYILFTAPLQQQRAWGLGKISEYACLGQKVAQIDGEVHLPKPLGTVYTSQDYAALVDQLEAVMAKARVDDVLKAMAAVLMLSAAATSEGVQGVEHIAALLAADPTVLLHALTHRHGVPLGVQEVQKVVSAAASAVHRQVVQYVLQMVNQHLPTGTGTVLSLIDAPGYHDGSGIDSLLTNHTADRIHASYCSLLQDISTYQEEGLSTDLVVGACTDLRAVFGLLDDACRLGNTSPAIAHTIHTQSALHAPNGYIANEFTVRHYAGDVTYSTVGMVQRTLDRCYAVQSILAVCTNAAVRGHLATGMNANRPCAGYSKELQAILSGIGTANYAVCLNPIKGNAGWYYSGQPVSAKGITKVTHKPMRGIRGSRETKADGSYGDYLSNQLSAYKVLQVLLLSLTGYPIHMPMDAFLHSYGTVFLTYTHCSMSGTLQEQCEYLVSKLLAYPLSTVTPSRRAGVTAKDEQVFQSQLSGNLALGKTKIFLRPAAHLLLIHYQCLFREHTFAVLGRILKRHTWARRKWKIRAALVKAQTLVRMFIAKRALQMIRGVKLRASAGRMLSRFILSHWPVFLANLLTYRTHRQRAAVKIQAIIRRHNTKSVLWRMRVMRDCGQYILLLQAWARGMRARRRVDAMRSNWEELHELWNNKAAAARSNLSSSSASGLQFALTNALAALLSAHQSSCTHSLLSIDMTAVRRQLQHYASLFTPTGRNNTMYTIQLSLQALAEDMDYGHMLLALDSKGSGFGRRHAAARGSSPKRCRSPCHSICSGVSTITIERGVTTPPRRTKPPPPLSTEHKVFTPLHRLQGKIRDAMVFISAAVNKDSMHSKVLDYLRMLHGYLKLYIKETVQEYSHSMELLTDRIAARKPLLAAEQIHPVVSAGFAKYIAHGELTMRTLTSPMELAVNLMHGLLLGEPQPVRIVKLVGEGVDNYNQKAYYTAAMSHSEHTLDELWAPPAHDEVRSEIKDCGVEESKASGPQREKRRKKKDKQAQVSAAAVSVRPHSIGYHALISPTLPTPPVQKTPPKSVAPVPDPPSPPTPSVELDDQSFTAMALTHILLGISACKPEHLMISPPSSSCRIVGMSMDSTVGMFSSMTDNALLCLTVMATACDAEVLARLTPDVLVAFIKSLHEQTYEGLDAADMAALQLPLRLPMHCMRFIYHRMQAITQQVAHGACTHADLLYGLTDGMDTSCTASIEDCALELSYLLPMTCMSHEAAAGMADGLSFLNTMFMRGVSVDQLEAIFGQAISTGMRFGKVERIVLIGLSSTQQHAVQHSAIAQSIKSKLRIKVIFASEEEDAALEMI